MRWLALFRQRLRWVLRPGKVDEELTRELQFHVHRETEENIAAGMTPDMARLAAVRSIGSLARLGEECRAVRRVNLVDDLRQDVRYALRSLARNPGFSAVAILTLALGIGANTAIFSVINAVLLRPLPLPAADRLVTIVENRPASEPFDGRPARRPPLPGDMRELQTQVRSLDAVYLYGGAPDIRPAGREDAPAMQGARMPGPAMASLGARAVLGRLPEADESGVVVLSASAWRRFFSEDRGVIGRTLSTTVGNVPSMQTTQVYTIVGILAPGFAFPDAGIDHWLSGTGPMNVARIGEGVSMTVAAEEISAVLHRIIGQSPAPASEQQGPPRFELVPLQEQIVGRMRPVLQLFGLVVAVVLLIACANVANLLLARSTTRIREVAVRAALGASRGRLIRQTLTESLLLSGIGGVVGTMLAFGGISLLRTLFTNFAAPPAVRQIGAGAGPASFPRIAEIQLDLTTLSFAAGVCVTAGLLFGLAPALRQTAGLSLSALRDGAASAVSGFTLFRRNGLRSTLVIAQVSLAMTLLVAGGLLIQSLFQLLTVSKGFDPANVLTFEVRHPSGRQSVPELRAFAEELMVRLQGTPGLISAAYAHDMPLIGPAQSTPLLLTPGERVPDSQAPGSSVHSPALRLVSRDFFSVTGTRIVAGRGFSADDRAALRAILINETLARARFGGENPIGRHVYLGRSDIAGEPLEIVGIVEDIRQRGLDVDPDPQMFIDFATWPGTRPAFDEPNYYAVRTSGDPRLVVQQVRNAVQRVSPGATIEQPLTLEDVVSSSVARPRTYAVLLGIFSAVGLILATVGVYGVMTYAVAQSTRELGVRLALGARRPQVLRFVLGRAGILAGIGIGIGLLGAFAATRSLQGMLYGLSPLDPLTFAGSALLFGGVAMLASYVPAHRAMRVDPLVALRCE
jgi:predicted permease